MPNPMLAWELLAMASTFAGNLTLLGSVANVIVSPLNANVPPSNGARTVAPSTRRVMFRMGEARHLS